MARSGRVGNKEGPGERLQGSPEVEIPNVKSHLTYSRPEVIHLRQRGKAMISLPGRAA